MDYKINNLKIEQLNEVLDLVKSVFDEFEAPYYSEYGIENFYKFANFDNLKKMLQENLKILVAKYNDKIIGMVAYRDYSHISMLFVDKEYHHKGIAKELTLKMIDDCIQNNKKVVNITVNSSPYAIGFYQLNSNPNEIPFENYLRIDNTNISAEDTAKIIKEKFNL